MGINEIIINGARVHNLKNISVVIPKNSFTVITGPSGSGKSSLAFDTLYAEGQRRYIESLSSYARQFLDQYQAPEVESITGLSPAIAIDQNTNTRNPRSTVGTITEVYDYLRLLFARVGTLYCPQSKQIIRKYSPAQVVQQILSLPERSKVQILAPVETNQLIKLVGLGFARIRVNGQEVMLDSSTTLENTDKVEVVVDRILVKKEINSRLMDSVEHAYRLGNGVLHLLVNDNEVKVFSEKNMSLATGTIYPDLVPNLFSFNSPLGACPECNGLGEARVFEPEMMILDPTISLDKGAVIPLNKKNSFLAKMFADVATQEGIDLNVPYKQLSDDIKKLIFFGSSRTYQFSFTSENSKFEFKGEFDGIVNALKKKYLGTSSEKVQKELEKFMNIRRCPSCHGQRLNSVALSTLIDGKNIMDLCSMSIGQLKNYFEKLVFDKENKIIAIKFPKR